MQRIIIIHYHMNPGGVTRIIESQVHAIKNSDPETEIIVLAGSYENPDPIINAGASFILEEKLNYIAENTDYNSEFYALDQFFSGFLRKDDIIHVHNLNLGKNPILTCVISKFARSGYQLVNHIHDFAEDRPVNYKFLEEVIGKIAKKPVKEILYPSSGNVWYLVLNSYDRRKLIQLGISPTRVDILPNPIMLLMKKTNVDRIKIRSAVSKELNLDSSKKIITYPVRVIRRKNIGEYILLCQLFKNDANWIVTQPPRNPVEIKPYNKWKEFCSFHNIPIYFEAGNSVDFESLLFASDYCFTTSVKEGFGMAYLEPWLFGVPVIGRNLPDITPDFKQSVIVFPMLYDTIDVILGNKKTDFALLSINDQKHYISDIIKNFEKKKRLFLQNRFLEKLLISVDQTLIEKNKAVILQEYSLETYAKRLKAIYQKITG